MLKQLRRKSTCILVAIAVFSTSFMTVPFGTKTVLAEKTDVVQMSDKNEGSSDELKLDSLEEPLQEENREQQVEPELVTSNIWGEIDSSENNIVAHFVYKKGELLSGNKENDRSHNLLNICRYSFDTFETAGAFIREKLDSGEKHIVFKYISDSIDYRAISQLCLEEALRGNPEESDSGEYTVDISGKYNNMENAYEYILVIEKNDECTDEQGIQIENEVEDYQVEYAYSEKKLMSYISLYNDETTDIQSETYETDNTANMCGENVFWSFDSENGKLVLTGSGAVTDYAKTSDVPWYSERTAITEVEIGDGITDIGSYAFYNCTNLSTVNMNESVAGIGNYTFYNCSSLKSIDLTNVKTLGEYAFSNSGLTSVSLEGQTDLGCRTFENCKSLDNIYYNASGASFTYYQSGYSLFTGCGSGVGNLKITIGPDVTGVGCLFLGCKNLTNIDLPENVKSIGLYAFYGCTNLSGITFSDNVTDIGEKAFYNCSSLKSIDLANVKTLGEYAFSNSGLTSVSLEGQTDLGCRTFENCKSLDNIYFNASGASFTYYQSGYSLFTGCGSGVGNLKITIGPDVTGVGCLFLGCKNLTSIDLPENVKSIGLYAFYGCTNLSEITFSDNVIKIGEKAFYNCSSLKSIDLKKVTEVGEYAFSNSGLTSITINDVNTLGLRAFENCKSLDEIYFNDTADYSVTYNTNGYGLFAGCGSGIGKMNVHVGDGVSLVYGLFAGCSNLTDITLPETVKTIGSYCFYGCRNLSSINLNNVTAIYNKAFANCTSLDKVTIDQNVELGTTPFLDATFNELVIGKNVEEIDSGLYQQTQIGMITVDSDNNNYCSEYGVLFDKDKKTLLRYPHGKEEGNYTVPSGVETVGDYSFYLCINLSRVTLAKSVISVGDHAFDGCETLEVVTFKAAVDAEEDESKLTIGSYAFNGCTSIETIKLPKSTTKVESYGFADCSSLSSVYFQGDAPALSSSSFYNDIVAICHTSDSLGWDDVQQAIGNQSVVFIDENKSYDRAVVMLLDRSWSMDGTPLDSMKEAAKKFCDSALSDSNCSVGLIIVPYCGTPAAFGVTSDTEKCEEYIDNIQCGNSTNLYDASLAADRYLKAIRATEKNIVIMSDGIPQTGTTTENGPYTSSDISGYYAYANAVYNSVKGMDSSYRIYTVGFFHLLADAELLFASRFMKDLQNTNHYEASEIDELIEVFGNISEEVTSGDITDIQYFAMEMLCTEYPDEYTFEENGKKYDFTGKTIDELLDTYPKFGKKKIGSNNALISECKRRDLYEQCLKGWRIADIYREDDIGFYAIVMEDTGSDKSVFVSRASDSLTEQFWKDWLTNDLPLYCTLQMAGIGPQFHYASEKLEEYVAKQEGKRQVYVTGHSLGAGLSIYLSTRYGLNGISFDAIPVLDAAYYNEPDIMGEKYYGFDEWKYIDYINRLDILAGLAECEYKNTYLCKNNNSSELISEDYLSKKIGEECFITDFADYLLPNIENIFQCHSMDTILNVDSSGLLYLDKDELYRPSNKQKVLSKSITSQEWGIKGETFFTKIDYNTKGLIDGKLFWGNTDANTIASFWHFNIVYGGAGADTISTGNLIDTVIGGPGNDFVDGGNGSDTYIYYKGHGTDTIFDIGGNDILKIYGYPSGTEVRTDTDSQKGYILVYAGTDLIAKISKHRSDSPINSFEVQIFTGSEQEVESMKIQDWNNWKDCKKITAACPVKMLVYDKNGNCLLEITDESDACTYTSYGMFYNVPEAESDSYEKMCYLFDPDNYYVELVGTDEGSMNYSVEWEDDQGENVVSYFASDIKISKGSTFNTEITGDAVQLLEEGEKNVELQYTSTPLIGEIKLDQSEVALDIEEKIQLQATVIPENSQSELVWESSDWSVATVTNLGEVTAVSPGVAQITVKNAEGTVCTSTKVIVNKPKTILIEEIQIGASDDVIYEGQMFQLGKNIYPENASDRTVIWTSSDASICTVDEYGNCKALQPGNVRFTCKATDGSGIQAQYSVQIKSKQYEKWMKNNVGYWYRYSDGSYPAEQWAFINGQWYHFDSNGYMQSGWQLIGGKWYYLGAANDGSMKTGWQLIGDKWYYFSGNGAMVTGWQLISGKWYYFSGSGAILTGWQVISGKWYYFSGSGAMVTGWLKSGDKWYYLSSSGAMQTGWLKSGGKWYYLSSSGAMVTNTWIGNCYLDSNGVWTKSR